MVASGPTNPREGWVMAPPLSPADRASEQRVRDAERLRDIRDQLRRDGVAPQQDNIDAAIRGRRTADPPLNSQL